MRPKCVNCGAVIEEVNFAMGKEWMHVDPNASFPTTGKGTMWRECRTGPVATPPGATQVVDGR